ncbi:unnamed protein product [Ophioblennius macclurei]
MAVDLTVSEMVTVTVTVAVTPFSHSPGSTHSEEL